MKTIKIKATFVFQVPDDEAFDIRETDIRWARKDQYIEEGADVGIEDLQEFHETAQTTDKKKVYIVTLQGQGDTTFYLVNESTFRFIEEGGRAPDDVVTDYVQEYNSFGQNITPERARYILESFGGSSPDNDRALAINGTFFNDERFILDSVNVKLANAFAEKHNLEIQEESYEGYIY